MGLYYSACSRWTCLKGTQMLPDFKVLLYQLFFRQTNFLPLYQTSFFSVLNPTLHCQSFSILNKKAFFSKPTRGEGRGGEKAYSQLARRQVFLTKSHPIIFFIVVKQSPNLCRRRFQKLFVLGYFQEESQENQAGKCLFNDVATLNLHLYGQHIPKYMRIHLHTVECI